MRLPLRIARLGGLIFLGAVTLASAQETVEPRAYTVGDMSFVLPAEWQTQTPAETPPPSIAFSAQGPDGGRLTIAHLPAQAAPAKPFPVGSNPMSAPETAELRVALEEAGLSPSAGALASATEGGAVVNSISFRCKSPSGRDMVILTTTWRTADQHEWRARLQYAEEVSPRATAIVNAVRDSLRLRGAPTLGFGAFARTTGPKIANAELWNQLANAPVRTSGRPPAALPLSPAVPSLPTPAEAPIAGDIGAMVQNYRGSLVFIEGGGGAGSGFVCRLKDGTALLTNQHVVAGMNAARFTRLDGSPVKAGAGAAAVAHDVMRFAVQNELRPLVAMDNVEAEARIGDDIIVLGNPEGARVIQPLAGKLVGIGPDRVEVTAEFVPGNSGSPIIHVKTGKVIGIATYLLQRRFTEFVNPNEAKVRRFGYRLDSVKQWQPLNWQAFQQEKAVADRVESTTKDLLRLVKEMQGDKEMQAVGYSNPALVRAVRELDTTLSKRSLSPPDRGRALTNFFAAVRWATQSDITEAKQTLHYDYFLQALGEETSVREELYKLFDRLGKAR